MLNILAYHIIEWYTTLLGTIQIAEIGVTPTNGMMGQLREYLYTLFLFFGIGIEDKMTSEQVVYWLQGYLELSGAKEFNEQQVQVIKDHIQLVMKKVTPNIIPYPNVGYIPTLTSDKVQLYPDGPKVYPNNTLQGIPDSPHKFETFCATLTDTTDMPPNIQTNLTC